MEPVRSQSSDALDRQIRYLEAQLREIEQDASSLGRDLELLATREALSRRRYQKAAAERDAVASGLAAEEAEAADLAWSLERTRAQAAAALREIYKRSSLAGYASVLSVDDPRDVMRAFQHLDVVSRRQLSAIRGYAEQLRESESRQETLARLRAELELAVGEAAEEGERLLEARTERLGMLERVERERSMHQEAAAELRRASLDLASMLDSISPGSSLPPLAVDLERLKGTLPWPVKGHLKHAFGDRRHPRFGTVTPHPGWDLRVEPGSPVSAVASGRVVFSHRFGGYGRTVVIDHGGRYLSVYARLGAAIVAAGDDLLPGQEVGFAPEPDADGNSSVYFEIRHQGRALDPAGWLRRARREARQ